VILSDAPFALGPFVVARDGRLTPATGGAPSFHIVWRGLGAHAEMRDVGDGSWLLRLRMVLARIPSTASSATPCVRDGAFATVHALAGALPDGWRVFLLPDHRLLLEAEPKLPLPASVGALLTEVTLFLLAVDPYLALLDEAGLGLAGTGVGPVAAPVGMAKTWPG
jgi:hypothetical protein